jgi:hypothetical protein
MDIKDLKTAWNTYSSQEVNKHRLGKETINDLLKTRTKSLVDRIDRNIRIGMYVLGIFISYFIIDYAFLTAHLAKYFIQEIVEYPKWLNFLDVFTTVLIVTTYLFFVIRYIKIKRNFSIDLQLKDILTGILDTIKTYRRMFYLAVAILLINMIVSFAAGLYQGVKFNADKTGVGIDNLTISKIMAIIGVGLAILIPFIAITFLLLRWGFNRLYGRYQFRLNETLQELDETGDLE